MFFSISDEIKIQVKLYMVSIIFLYFCMLKKQVCWHDEFLGHITAVGGAGDGLLCGEHRERGKSYPGKPHPGPPQ